MIIQSPAIRRRDGMVTASGIQVVPDPILSILTPAGPIIMSSVEWPCMPGISIPGCTPFMPGIEPSRFSPGMAGMFIRAESGFEDMFGMFMCVESFAAAIGADSRLGADLTGIGIAIVDDRVFVLMRDLLPALVLTALFFPALADFAWELPAPFFF
jgi:hypothetical protein